MKLNLKLFSVIVLIQIVTAALVFTLTRAYYREGTSIASASEEQSAVAEEINRNFTASWQGNKHDS